MIMQFVYLVRGEREISKWEFYLSVFDDIGCNVICREEMAFLNPLH